MLGRDGSRGGRRKKRKGGEGCVLGWQAPGEGYEHQQAKENLLRTWPAEVGQTGLPSPGLPSSRGWTEAGNQWYLLCGRHSAGCFHVNLFIQAAHSNPARKAAMSTVLVKSEPASGGAGAPDSTLLPIKDSTTLVKPQNNSLKWTILFTFYMSRSGGLETWKEPPQSHG